VPASLKVALLAVPHALVPALVLALGAMGARPAFASSSADELVRQARAHEAAHEEDVALRRYNEALLVDRTSADAWMGLGELRLRLGEAREAETVYDTAMTEIPTLRGALRGRARARWALGKHAEAEDDLDAYAVAERDPAALRQLADWFGADGRAPAQLATWRRLLAAARDAEDAALEHEARIMVRALVVLVDGADPAASPASPDATRRALSRIAARGG
jgi:tetratricopeptide (TPR) repeat protein